MGAVTAENVSVKGRMTRGAQSYTFLSRDRGIQRGGLATHVAHELRRAIVEGHLPPGTMLDKGRICERLKVSRSPVAEAFARLQAEGLLAILPQRGTVVTHLSVTDVEEFVFIRRALETEAMHAVAEKRDSGLLETLDDNIAAQYAAAARDDRDTFHTLDSAFHDMLMAALSHQRIRGLVETARNNLSRARQMTNSPQRIAEGIAQHAAIVEAIRDGDGGKAAQVMYTHLDGILFEISALAQRRPELFEPASRGAIHKTGTIRRLSSP